MHALAFALACTACVVDEEPDPGPQQTCAESEQRVLEISQDMIAEFASPCAVDADCEIVSVSADCPNGEPFRMPDEAIAFDRFQEASAFVASRADEVCLQEQCFFPRYDNFYAYAYCDEGACRGTPNSPERFCPALASLLTSAASELAQELPHTCETDDDCVAFTPEFVCEEFELRAQGCAVILAVDEDINTTLQEGLAPLCQERNVPCDALDTACGEVAPACIDGVCVNNQGT